MNDIAVENALANMRLKSRGVSLPASYPVTINFHPDRFTSNNQPLLLAIAEQGYLKSQFETGTSNGGLTAFKGGERWLWEQRVFDGAYDLAPNTLRPKYGALNFRGYEFGASPRFGSAYFQLKPHSFERTTFCYPDSFFEPDDFAVSDRLTPLIEKASQSNEDLLDDYIEAHIHGVVSIKEDVECLVLDPIYRNTAIEKYALLLGIPLRWHKGYELSIEQMSQYPDYRGQQFIDLAKQIAHKGMINTFLLGRAVTQQGFNEQDVKKIWHYLARFGYRQQ
ncbi:DUF3626 domain-containing protein [Vibrio comitans]|uniref:DUF3626 domain-containing protein n=1 Tax=Vibrio comitans NBRC 102076 TaxID=1219078 RepID=A0A4Y3IIP4_9VIBR|nr:DUF3626 domain-containing protein [Vibrio comitans]GEA59363.1 hypothetical protein VCO01S_05560 [Vibrio comitans NBRC 102076]